MVVTYVCRIRGIFTQFAAATAANGTYLPIRGGADCENNTIKIISQHELNQISWLIIAINTAISIAHKYRYT